MDKEHKRSRGNSREKKSPFYLMSKKQYPSYEGFIEELDNGEKLPFKPALVAKWLMENENFKTDLKTGMLYFFDGRSWTANGEAYLHKIISTILAKEDKESHFRNILYALKGLTLCNIEFSKKIAVENGLLDLEALPLELIPFSPKEMPFYYMPVTYNPNIDKHKLDNWIEFLKQVANPEDIPLLQEWFGFCLLPEYSYHKVLWIHGDGRNGKGVFDRTIQGIIGSKNIATVGLEELDGNHRFALKNYYGKLYAVSSEPATNKVFRTEIFQKLSGSDTIQAEFKVMNQTVEFRNCAKLTIIGNKFPKIHNPTVAFKDRMMFVKFPNFFSDKDRIANLENVWLNDSEQRSAIFNWAIEGLQRLISQNGFTKTKTQEQTEIEFDRTSNTIGAFQKEMGILDKNLVTPRAVALDAYATYCDAIGVEPERNSEFTQQMQNLKPKVKDGWTRIARKKERAWIGFGLKTIDELDLEQLPQLEQQNTFREFLEDNSKNIENKIGVPNVPTVPLLQTNQLKVVAEDTGLKRVDPMQCCGGCGKFHLASCGFPNEHFETLPEDWYAGGMRCFIPKQPEMPSFDDKVGAGV